MKIAFCLWMYDRRVRSRTALYGAESHNWLITSSLAVGKSAAGKKFKPLHLQTFLCSKIQRFDAAGSGFGAMADG